MDKLRTKGNASAAPKRAKASGKPKITSSYQSTKAKAPIKLVAIKVLIHANAVRLKQDVVKRRYVVVNNPDKIKDAVQNICTRLLLFLTIIHILLFISINAWHSIHIGDIVSCIGIDYCKPS